ncbi:MAG: P-II family nitrogen regulator [Deltaproteobacteria bacterium]
MPTLHSRKKVELIVERARLEEILEVAQEAGAKGYTVLPTLSGLGNRGERADDLTGVGGNVLVVIITRDAVAHRSVELLAELWGDAIGVLFVSDVEVLRPDKF